MDGLPLNEFRVLGEKCSARWKFRILEFRIFHQFIYFQYIFTNFIISSIVWYKYIHNFLHSSISRLLFYHFCPTDIFKKGEMRWTEFQSWEPLEFWEEQVLTMKIFIFCICPNLIKLLLVKCKPLSSKLKMDNFKTGGHSFATALLLSFLSCLQTDLYSNICIFSIKHCGLWPQGSIKELNSEF